MIISNNSITEGSVFPSVNDRPIKKASQLAKDPCLIISSDVVRLIFSYLNIRELGTSRCVSGIWSRFANTPILWQSVIYREFAFNSKNWAQCSADIVRDVDTIREMLSLPMNIAEELRKSAFPGKSIRETHVLVRMPEQLTIKKLGELAKKYFPLETASYICPEIVHELGDKAAKESVWLLMITTEVKERRKISDSNQRKIIAELAQTTQVSYEIPTVLEAATCCLAEYSRSKRRISGTYIYILCQEKLRADQIMVGFRPKGFYVGFKGFEFSVAALRKL